MNIIEFYTENLEFKVRFKKELRRYSLSKFGRYKITIEFINSIEQTVLLINTTEKEFISALESLNNFSTNFGNITDDIIYFECSLIYLEDFIFKMYKLVEDIPYLEDIFRSSFLEYMQYNSII